MSSFELRLLLQQQMTSFEAFMNSVGTNPNRKVFDASTYAELPKTDSIGCDKIDHNGNGIFHIFPNGKKFTFDVVQGAVLRAPLEDPLVSSFTLNCNGYALYKQYIRTQEWIVSESCRSARVTVPSLVMAHCKFNHLTIKIDPSAKSTSLYLNGGYCSTKSPASIASKQYAQLMTLMDCREKHTNSDGIVVINMKNENAPETTQYIMIESDTPATSIKCSAFGSKFEHPVEYHEFVYPMMNCNDLNRGLEHHKTLKPPRHTYFIAALSDLEFTVSFSEVVKIKVIFVYTRQIIQKEGHCFQQDVYRI